MNELCNTTHAAAKIRKTLLATASALALATYVSLPEGAQAAGDDRPTVWVEGGFQFESVIGENDLFVPPLDAPTRSTGLSSLTAIENTLGRTYGAEGSISFQPKSSDWVFTASGRYGRVQSARNVLSQKVVSGPQMKSSEVVDGAFVDVLVTPTFDAYARGVSSNSETHAIVDFQVGKDVGVGLFGRGTELIISFGARYAQMSARSNAHSYAEPDPTFEQAYFAFGNVHKYAISIHAHHSAAFVARTDSLHALGPSLSMKNTTGLLGTVDDGQLALDWGVNAALLFGRQKAKTSHHSTVTYLRTPDGIQHTTQVYPAVTRTRSRMVTIPNIGGFAGLSYRFSRAKISAGYRADFFFGAKDSGLETRSTTDIGFHGPYATISIGLGG